MSKATEEVIAIEKGFWIHSNDPQYFAEHLGDDGVTVIEPMGFIAKPMAVESAKQGEPFTDVELTDVIVREIAPDVVMLVYHGHGERDGGKPYQGSICSVYVKRAGRWQAVLSAHQPWKPKPEAKKATRRTAIARKAANTKAANAARRSAIAKRAAKTRRAKH